MPALIGPIGTVVNMNQAVFGNALGNPAYASQLLVAESVGGQAQIIAGYNAQLANTPAAALATTVMNNLFLTTAAGLPQASVTALNAAIVQAFQTYPTAKGQVISNLTNLLGNLETDPLWGPSAIAFNNQAAADYTYSINPANTNAGIPSTTTTFTLTVNADGPGAVAPAVNTQGGSGNDTYNGTFSGTAANTDNGTLNSADNLAGGTGTDSALIRVLTSFGLSSTNAAAGVQDFRAPIMSSVETVLASNLNAVAQANTTYGTGAAGSATGIATINMVSATGTTTVGSQDSAANTFTEFSNTANGTAISLNNADGYTAVQILGAASRAGTTDALNVTISNGSGPTAASATATGNFGVYTTLATASATGVAAVVDNTYEVLNVTTSGAFSRVNADLGTNDATNSVTTVNVSGTGAGASATGFALQLSQTGAFANVTTINASGMTGTGGLYIVTNNAQNLTFTGSANNDRLDIGVAGNLTAADVINFGAGYDTLGIANTNVAVSAEQKVLINATGAERIAFTSATFAGDSLASYTANDFSIATAHVGLTTAMTGLSSARNLFLAADLSGTAGAAGAAGGNVGNTGSAAVTLAAAGVGTTANIALTGGTDLLGGATGASTGNIGGAAGAAGLSFASANFSTLTIASTGTVANTITGAAGAAANGGNTNGGAGGAAIDNTTNSAVQSVTITGAQNLTLTGGAGGALSGNGTAGAAGASFSGAAAINASAFTGLLTMSGSNGSDVITSGSGGMNLQTVAISTSTDGDQITLGSGRDQIAVNVNSSRAINNSSTTTMDRITSFTSGTDKFVVGTAVSTVLSGAAFSAAGTGVLSTDIGTAITNAGGAAVLTAGTVALVTITGIGAGTYLVIESGANAGYVSTEDAVVQLIGTSTVATGDFVTAFLG